MKIVKVIKLAGGKHEPRKPIVHAVAISDGEGIAYSFNKALCGSAPTGKSAGWSSPLEAGVTCGKCLRRLNIAGESPAKENNGQNQT
jgi:hypothetical protein